MSRLHRCVLCAILFSALGLLAAPPARAADSKVLEPLPDDVLAAIIVPQWKSFDAKVTNLGNQLKFPVPPPVATALSMEGALEGLDESGAIVVALLPPNEKKEVCTLGFLPTSNYQKLIAQFSPEDKGGGISQISVPDKPTPAPLLVAQKGGYAVFVGSREGDRKILEREVARKAAAPDALAPLADWIAGQDAVLIASRSGMELAKKTFEDMKPKFAGLAAGGPNGNSPLDMYSNLLAALEREATQIGIGLRIDADANIRLDTQVRFAADGSWAKAGANLPAPTAPPMTGLPAGEYLFAFDGATGGTMGDAVGGLFASSIKSMIAEGGRQPSDEEMKQLTLAMKGFTSAAKSTAMVMNVPQPGGSMYSGAYALQRVDDAQATFKSYIPRVEEYQKALKVLNSSLFGDYEAKQTNIDGIDAIEVSYSMADHLEKIRRDSPAMAQQMEAMSRMMFGPEGKMSTYLAPAGKNLLVMVFVDPDHLKLAIEAAQKPSGGLADDESVKTTIALLPKQSQWIGLVSPRGMIHFFQTMMQTVAPGLPFQFPEFTKTPPIGGAARISAEGLDAEIVVPAAVLEGAGMFVQDVQRTMNVRQ